MRVWIDLTNTPHVLFFEQTVKELERQGHEVLVTARRFAYTVELAKERIPQAVVVGQGSKKSIVGKIGSLAGRSSALVRMARSFRPHVAVSHGSVDQAIAAKVLRIPAMSMVDYEYQPANHVTFRLAHRLLLPAAFDAEVIARRGGAGKTARYSCLKEEAYLAAFEPDPQLAQQVGIEGHQGPVVTLRPAPSGALYHRGANPFFDRLIGRLEGMDDVITLVLPRHRKDVPDLLAHFASGRVHILEEPVDGPSLVWASDLVISGGGTMNREAVALGVPVYTLFAGQMGSVDQALIARGVLKKITTDAEVDALEVNRRVRTERPETTWTMRDTVIANIEATARRQPVAP
jgi:uncharacterized protein